ncbi:MAG: DUF4911 domain-containing protein [Myxococcales bacterium]|nr:MAG: DUF4911 domain-containing protein [Myxococcales bacterium]
MSQMKSQYIRLEKSQIAYFRFILEGYEGLSTWHSHDDGLISLSFPEGRGGEIDDFLEALAMDIPITLMDRD